MVGKCGRLSVIQGIRFHLMSWLVWNLKSYSAVLINHRATVLVRASLQEMGGMRREGAAIRWVPVARRVRGLSVGVALLQRPQVAAGVNRSVLTLVLGLVNRSRRDLYITL
jgi:hypothetical protein